MAFPLQSRIQRARLSAGSQGRCWGRWRIIQTSVGSIAPRGISKSLTALLSRIHLSPDLLWLPGISCSSFYPTQNLDLAGWDGIVAEGEGVWDLWQAWCWLRQNLKLQRKEKGSIRLCGPRGQGTPCFLESGWGFLLQSLAYCRPSRVRPQVAPIKRVSLPFNGQMVPSLGEDWTPAPDALGVQMMYPKLVGKGVKESACNVGDAGSIPGSGRFPGEGNPLQYSCLKNPMDRGAWWAIVQGVAESQTWLSYLVDWWRGSSGAESWWREGIQVMEVAGIFRCFWNTRWPLDDFSALSEGATALPLGSPVHSEAGTSST